MRTLRLVFTILLLSFVAARSPAGDHSLGPMGITGDQTIFLHFIGNGAEERPFPVAVRFFDSAGEIGTAKAVKLYYLESEMIELDGDALGIAGVPGVIRAGTDDTRNVSVVATLEIIDKATGAVKAVLSSGEGVGTSKGDGGAGSR